MISKVVTFCALFVVLTIGLAVVVSAQDQATPISTPASDEVLCATPLAAASGTPEIVATAPTTAASPGGSEPGTPIGLFPCGTPAP